jgi:hypothetical protein
MLLHSAEPRPPELKKLRYNPLCEVGEESSSDMLSKELVIDSDDVINLEIEGQTESEESRFEISESERESETSVVAC